MKPKNFTATGTTLILVFAGSCAGISNAEQQVYTFDVCDAPDAGAGGFITGDSEGRCVQWLPKGYGDPHIHAAI